MCNVAEGSISEMRTIYLDWGIVQFSLANRQRRVFLADLVGRNRRPCPLGNENDVEVYCEMGLYKVMMDVLKAVMKDSLENRGSELCDESSCGKINMNIKGK